LTINLLIIRHGEKQDRVDKRRSAELRCGVRMILLVSVVHRKGHGSSCSVGGLISVCVWLTAGVPFGGRVSLSVSVRSGCQ